MRTQILIALVLAACGKDEPAAAQKLRKMAFKAHVDETGRMMPFLELFDEKHRPMTVEGSYTLTLSRPDGTVLCSVTQRLEKSDFTPKHAYKTAWRDATCPADPAADQLRVSLEVKTGDKPDDLKLSREMTTPVKFIYQHLGKPEGGKPAVDPTKLPAEAPLPEPPPQGSTAGSASGAASGAASGSAMGSASGSAAVMGSASDAPKPPPDGSAGSAR